VTIEHENGGILKGFERPLARVGHAAVNGHGVGCLSSRIFRSRPDCYAVDAAPWGSDRVAGTASFA
jgi:hypothetical protein